MHHLPLAKATFFLLLLPPHPPPSTVAFFCTLHFHLAGRSNNHQNAATNSTPLCSARARLRLCKPFGLQGYFNAKPQDPAGQTKHPQNRPREKSFSKRAKWPHQTAPSEICSPPFCWRRSCCRARLLLVYSVFCPGFSQNSKVR